MAREIDGLNSVEVKTSAIDCHSRIVTSSLRRTYRVSSAAPASVPSLTVVPKTNYRQR